MKKAVTILGYLILLGTIAFHLWLNYPEIRILGDPNDNIFQFSLVARTDWVWKNYGCPLSLSCLPNISDHNVTAWAEGYPLPFYYSHIPQIVTVGSYHLIVEPLIKIFHIPYSLYQYYNLTKYLLLCFFPLSIFLAMRIVGFSVTASSLAAFFGSNMSTDGLYGIDPPSFLWRGYGLTSQLYAMIFFPLGIAFTYLSMRDIKSEMKTAKTHSKPANGKEIIHSKIYWRITHILEKIRKLLFSGPYIYFSKNTMLAGIFLTLTCAGHLGMGIMGLLSTIPFLFFDLNIKHIIVRIKKIAIIGIIVIGLLAYWIVPMLFNLNYHIISFWDPIWKFNSYGWYEVLRQLFQGEVFDWKRLPTITAVVMVGFFVLLSDTRLFPLALLFGMWMLMYFGKTTWGGLIDLIPGMKDFHQHRFIVAVQITALFLIPGAFTFIYGYISRGIAFLTDVLKKISKSNQSYSLLNYFHSLSYILISLLVIVLGYFTVKQTYDYAYLNNKWIDESNKAFIYDEKNFKNLMDYMRKLPNARVYAGRPGNWGKDFRLGSSQMYMLFGISGFDVSQFLPETWSMLSENEQNFDERNAIDYDLLNIKYVIAPKNQGFADTAELDRKFGPFELYKVPTSGWFDVVTSPMFVRTDKTNFLNLVQLWHRSFPRRWKMYPLISVDKKPTVPADIQRNIKMVDEVTYEENGKQKNIFADFPLVFPESTPSGKVLSEKVEKQTYTGVVDIPDNCKSCYVMFKMSYHPDFQAKLDGMNVEKFAVFPYYIAVSIPAGKHTVEVSYKSNMLKTVLIYTEIIFLILFIFRKKIMTFL